MKKEKKMIGICVALAVMAMIFLSGCQDKANETIRTQADDGLDEDENETEQPTLEGTCFDGIMNQEEEDVDCGGPCEPCSVAENESSSDAQEQEENLIPGNGYKLSTEQEEMLAEKLKKTTKGTFLTNSYPGGLKIGESYVFAYGISNTDYSFDPSEFRFNVLFDEARDNSNNRISVDEETILGWVEKNKFEIYNLSIYEQRMIPVGITVGEEVAPGKKTPPGIYYFEMEVEYRHDTYDFKDYITSGFSFRVID